MHGTGLHAGDTKAPRLKCIAFHTCNPRASFAQLCVNYLLAKKNVTNILAMVFIYLKKKKIDALGCS